MPLPVESLIEHSRGQLVISGSRARSATMASFQIVTGAKVKHTLAVQANGIVYGNAEAKVTIEVDISDEGPERDWISDLLSHKIRNVVFEIPKVGITFQVGVDSIDGKMPLDDAVNLTINCVGKVVGAPVPTS